MSHPVAPGPLVLTGGGLALLLVAEWRQSHLGKWLTKPVASLGFVWLALQQGALHSGWGRAVFIGLLLCLAGDVLLIPKDKRIFLAGLGTFLLGHLAFAVAFLLRGADLARALVLLLPLAIPAALVVRWLWPRLSRRMRGPVVAYVVVISLMLDLALATFAVQATPLLLVGALLFYLSDLFVARNRFMAPGFENRLVGLPLYYGAQILIALSVAEGVVEVLSRGY